MKKVIIISTTSILIFLGCQANTPRNVNQENISNIKSEIGTLSKPIVQTNNQQISAITVTSDSKYILVGDHSGEITIWDYKSGKKLKSHKKHTMSVSRISMTNNGEDVISCPLDYKCVRWNLLSGNTLNELTIPKAKIPRNESILINNDSQQIMINLLSSHELWDFKKKKIIQKFNLFQEGYVHVLNMKILSKRQQLLVHLEENKNNKFITEFRLYDIQTGKEVKRFGKEKFDTATTVSQLKISLKNDKVLVKMKTKVSLWDINRAKKIFSFNYPELYLAEESMIFTLNEDKILIRSLAMRGGEVKYEISVYSAKSGKKINVIDVDDVVDAWSTVPNNNSLILIGMQNQGFSEISIEN